MIVKLDEPRRQFWQTRVWLRREEVDERAGEMIVDADDIWQTPYPRPRTYERWEAYAVIGDETLEDLGEQVATFLREQGDKLTSFANVAEGNKHHSRVRYVLATANTLREQWVQQLLGSSHVMDQPEGWWVTGLGAPSPLGSLDDAAAHFLRHAMVPDRGPGWRDLFAHNEALPLHLMRTVTTLKTKDQLNEALNRGWYLLAIEFKGFTTDQGELSDREAHYVIGHLGEHAR